MKQYLLFFILSVQSFAQVPAPAYNPMTAPGASGINYFSHTLFWQNPGGVIFNECYFSTDSVLVANLDPSARILNGHPSTVYNSLDVNALEENTKYFWRIVEYNSSGSTPSPVWYFTTVPYPIFLHEFTFNNDWDGWTFKGPLGIQNWFWSNSALAGSFPGEIIFKWDPVFWGDSYIMSPEIHSPVGSGINISFKFYEDWWADTVNVGCAITTDNGLNWNTIWELKATGNVGPDNVSKNIIAEGNFHLGFFYKGNSDNIDLFIIDDVIIQTPLSPPLPPSLLIAEASDEDLKVNLSWNAGNGPSVSGYYIERKNGLPNDTSSYVFIGQTDASTLSFSDETVEMNKIYTYRILTLSGPFSSHYGNEATAYVPEFVPVELVSFSANVEMNNVRLNWVTSTETNNRGFEIQRRNNDGKWKIEDGKFIRQSVNEDGWDVISFVEGKGTTTEQQFYSYIDENLSAGKYQYRLKQMDFDGTYEYSNIVEVEINQPLEFSLSQNYPNPFNPTTKIKYTIPQDERGETKNVRLIIYDVLGNEVAILVNEEKQPGVYEVEFDAGNLSSGIYVYKLIAAGFHLSKKMVVLK